MNLYIVLLSCVYSMGCAQVDLPFFSRRFELHKDCVATILICGPIIAKVSEAQLRVFMTAVI